MATGSLKRFKTYGAQSRREFDRKAYSHKAKVRAVRLDALYSKTVTTTTY